MAKNTFSDFSTTASNNTDIAGIDIQGTAAVANFDNALQTLMAILRTDLDNGTVIATKTGNYTALETDNNAVHRYTAAATVSLTAAATLGSGWHYTVVASGTDVTIDPSESETINGKATLLILDGSQAFIFCTGTAFYATFSSPQQHENLLINGNFNINQRVKSGTVVLAAGVYGHDMWKGGASGCTYTFSTSGGVTTLTISAGSLIQKVSGENLQTGTHVLSWTGTATGKIGAGSLSASGITETITGGTDTNIEFSTGTLSLVQLEPGSAPTAFEYRPFLAELNECQRFYCHSYEYGTAPGASDAAGALSVKRSGANETTTAFNQRFSVDMKDVPTVTWYSPNTGTADRVYDASAATNVIVTGTSTAVPTSTKAPGFPTHSASGLGAGAIIIAHFVAEVTW